MSKITEYIKRNKKLSIGIVTILILVILVLTVLYINCTSRNNEEKNVISSNIAVIKEYDTLSQQEFSRETLDTFASYIASGNSGVYTIDNRYFIILTTGGRSATDIHYKIESTTEGKLKVYHSLSNTPDGEVKLRYKIIELDSPEVEILLDTPINTDKVATGFSEILVFKYNGEKKIYSIAEQKLIQEDTWETDGAYMGNFIDGKLDSCEPISSVEIKGCIVKEKVKQSNNLYTIEIPSNDLIQVYIDNKNLDTEGTITLELGYDAVMQGLIGKVVKGALN